MQKRESMTEQTYKKSQILLIYLALLVSALIAYEPLRRNGFVNYDDDKYITENPHVLAGITRDSVIWAFTGSHFHMWHPLTSLSHELDCQMFGLNPFWHHLTSLFFHVANALLLFWVLKKMTGALWPSAFVAAVFALHPLQVESVAWAAERKTVLSGFFWLLTMVAYVRYAQQPGIKRYLLVVLAFCLGLLSKPMVVTLPFALLLLDYWPLGRLKWAGKDAGENISHAESAALNRHFSSAFYLVVEKVPLFVLSAILSAVTCITLQSGDVIKSIEMFPLKSRIINAAASYLGYIIKIFYPNNLAAFYPYPKTLHILALIIPLIGISVLFTPWVRRRGWLTVALLWYLGTLVPVIGLVQVGGQAMADRYTYLPSIGVFIIIAWGAAELGAKWPYGRVALRISAAMVLVVLSVCTRMQVRYWQNSVTLFERALAVTRDNWIAHEGYATAMVDEGRFDEAVSHYTQALRIEPKLYIVHTNLGMVFLEQGKIDQAAACFQMALRLKPDFPLALNNLGRLLTDQGKIDEAATYIEKAIQSDPDYPLSYYSMARIKTQQKQYSQAIEYLEAALQRKPDWPEVYASLGKNWFLMGNVNRGISYWHRALELDPAHIGALNDLARVLATTEDTKLRNPTDAVKYARSACELTRFNRPVFLDSLALAYAAAGNFPEAVKTAEKAVQLAEAMGKKGLAEEIRKRLDLYKSGRPYREK